MLFVSTSKGSGTPASWRAGLVESLSEYWISLIGSYLVRNHSRKGRPMLPDPQPQSSQDRSLLIVGLMLVGTLLNLLNGCQTNKRQLDQHRQVLTEIARLRQEVSKR